MANLKVKNWEKFQHFKDRRPPWIKLYRDILDDREWHKLDPCSAKVLVMLWLIASEDETQNGILPCVEDLAFRLRMDEFELNQTLTNLDKWLIQHDNSTISDCYQTDAPETETETELFAHHSAFDEFWAAYPKKKNKGDAEKAWKALKPKADLLKTILEAVEVAKRGDDWRKENGQFIPYPATWLRAKGWEDEPQMPVPQRKGVVL